MKILLDDIEKAAYLNAVACGLFDEETILKHMVDIFELEFVELAPQNDTENKLEGDE